MKRKLLIFSIVLITGLENLNAQDTTMQQKGNMDSNNKMNMDKMNMDKMNMDKMNMDKMNMDKMSMDKMSMDKMSMMKHDVSTWPEASRMAVEEITAKYGKPDGVTADELIWINKGVWKKICINKSETKHSFPIEHTDMMQTTITYKVPEEKMDELGKFDGSITFDRTQGTMSARCDKEANNFLALNLANDIILSKKTVEQARVAYGNIVREKMKGGNPAYMQKLSFSKQSNTADPDKNTTGLTKEDVMKGMKNKK